MLGPFSRTGLLLGEQALDVLARAHVAVFGIGGVGGMAAEALARSGIGAIDLVDSDTVDTTNLNRQIVATVDVIGQPKVHVMAERIARINPQCTVTPRVCFYLPETADQFDFAAFDYVVDAVDTMTAKLQLVEAARTAGTPIVSSMGTGNKLDPTAFRVSDIYDTRVCPLAKIMRKECRKRGIDHLKVVYSEEEPLKPTAAAGDGQPASGSRRSTPGSVAFVPPAAGLALASVVVRDLIEHATATGEETLHD